MKTRTTQVPGEPAQYNGWTGAELLELVFELQKEIRRLEELVVDLSEPLDQRVPRP